MATGRKVLLTGASGFVGSHLLERLCAAGIPTVALVRRKDQQESLSARFPQAGTQLGSIDAPATVAAALRGVTHVVHCAGCTKALRTADFFTVNQLGARHVVTAVNEQAGQVRRLVHISSLAAVGPATSAAPAREDASPRPVSDYGRSKLAGEEEVRRHCRTEWVILRPPGVYGPRDREFLRLFKAVRAHACPSFGGGRQELSLVYVKDLVEIAVACLTHPQAANQTYHVAADEVVTARGLAQGIARQMSVRTVPLPLPWAVLWCVCVGQEVLSKLTRRASVLDRQKYAELRAAGWVSATGKLRQELGLTCATTLAEGLAQTLAWYRQAGWL